MAQAHDLYFDRAAGWYDFLARMVFGSSIRDLERGMIHQIGSGKNLCWIGGGTGEILPGILSKYPHLRIDYVETSPRMMAKAMARIDGKLIQKVTFWQSYDEYAQDGNPPDALLLSCIMDLFGQEELCQQLTKWTQHNPTVLAVDFIIPSSGVRNWLGNLLIPTMYRFFHLAIGLPMRRLPDWNAALSKNGYQKTSQVNAWMGLLEASSWKHSGV